jgi:hypothetical protein
LHEGRCYRIFSSSTKQALTGTEVQPVRRSVRRYRIRPTHLAGVVPDQEEELSFKLFQDGFHPGPLEPRFVDQVRERKRFAAVQGEIPNRRIADPMVLGRHEGETFGHVDLLVCS